MYLLDTNIVIYYLKGKLPAPAMSFMRVVLDEHPNISAITKIELLGYNFTYDSERKVVESFVDGCDVLVIDGAVINPTIELRRLKKVKLPDAIIAATAIVYNLTLLSRNTADFKDIPGLKLENPLGQ